MSSQPEETKKSRRGKRPPAAEAAQEETKGQPAQNRPKTAGRGKREGAQAAAGAGKSAQGEKTQSAGRGQRRPQTARDVANAAEGVEEETKGDVQNRGSKGGQQRQRQNDKRQDKNSWIYKYHNMERPQYEKIVFTAETEIPELPAAKDRLKEPSQQKF